MQKGIRNFFLLAENAFFQETRGNLFHFTLGLKQSARQTKSAVILHYEIFLFYDESAVMKGV